MRFEQHEELVSFIRDYYAEEVARLCQEYPNDSRSIWIDWMDLYKALPDVAEDYLVATEQISEYIREAINAYDKPLPIEFDNLNIRVYNSRDELTPPEVREEDVGTYKSIRGVLGQVTDAYEVPETIVYECIKCHTHWEEPQADTKRIEPTECYEDRGGCGRKGPFEIHAHKSDFRDESKLLIETPPDETGAIDGGDIRAFVTDDLIDYGGEYGLSGHVGEEVVISGVIKREARGERGRKALRFDEFLEAHAVEFTGSDANVEVETYEDEFKELAAREDAVEVFASSIAPELYATPEWEAALELGVAYLFAAPRIDIDDGPTYRGDIHALLISDYGMGKSTFLSGVESFSPKCMKRSAAGLGSDVGLTAAAVQDEFADGGWTIKPGILVRGNNGHVILDEIDKGPDELSAMNDGLEGDQMLSVNKGGKDMTLKSRVGLLAAGNPVNSRFDPHAPVADEIGIDQSLLSRFDGIVTMRDTPDEEVDSNVAEHIAKGFKEATEKEHGDREDFEALSRIVDPEVGRAWVKYARDNINPDIPDGTLDRLSQWYAEEARQLNEEYGDDSTNTDPPVPVTPRVVEDVLRFSMAFARCELSDVIEERHFNRATTLVKTLIGQTFRDGVADATHGRASQKTKPTGQKAQIEAIMQELNRVVPDTIDVEELSELTNIPEDKVKSRLEQHKRHNPQPVIQKEDGWRSA